MDHAKFVLHNVQHVQKMLKGAYRVKTQILYLTSKQ